MCSVVDRLPGGRGDKPYVFRIISPTQPTALEIAASSEEDMLQWIQSIRECSCNAERAVCLQLFAVVSTVSGSGARAPNIWTCPVV